MKAILVKDAATAIPAITFRIAEALGDEYTAAADILVRGGYGAPPIDPRYVVLVALGPELEARVDPFCWGNATMVCAHLRLIDHFDSVEHGQDFDVEADRTAMIEAGRL